jgi:DNA-binding CsgD family transcriptional regulator/PAS domain-containing protein
MELSDKERSNIFLELMDCVGDFVLILDFGLKVVKANRSASLLLGYSMDELFAKRLPLLIDADERDRIVNLIRASKERQGDKTVLLTRLKQKVPVIFSLRPMSGIGKRPLCYLLVGRLANEDRFIVGSDVSSGLVERILKGLSDPLLILDGPSRTVSDCNEAALVTFCISREELVGRWIFDNAKSGDERRHYQALEERVDETFATAGIFHGRILFPRKSAPPLPCDCTRFPFFQPDGILSSIIVILYDRSIEEEREAELAQLIEQADVISAKIKKITSEYSTCVNVKRLSDLGFSPRQIEIARLIASGASTKDIGFRLGIAQSTVRNHLVVIFRKLGVVSRMHFMRILVEQHIRIA